MNNREKLITVMIDHELERRELAELLLVDRQTVDDWLAPHESSRNVDVPDMAIELLRLKLGASFEDERGPEGSGSSGI